MTGENAEGFDQVMAQAQTLIMALPTFSPSFSFLSVME
jgi:hypothetical protein